MTVICFTGSDQKGQDALVEVLIRLLSDAGRAVSVIVHANEDDPLDTPGKDTHAHAEAGADFVAPSDMMDGRIDRKSVV